MLVETPYIRCHIATKCVHNKRRWSSMYSIEVWSVLSDLGKLCIAGHRFYPCVIPLWWNSNSLHMLVPPCICIYIYIPAAWTKRRIWLFSELTLAKFMVLPKRSTNVSLTKFESRSWIKQTPRSFPFSRSRTTNLAVLAENLSVTPPTPHDWSLRPMILCLNRTGKRSEIYNLHIVGLQREDSPRKLPHPKKQRFNLPTPFTLWLSLGPPYRVFFLEIPTTRGPRGPYRKLGTAKTLRQLPQMIRWRCEARAALTAPQKGHWIWICLEAVPDGLLWILMAEFPTSQIPKGFLTHTHRFGCRKPWDVYIYIYIPKAFHTTS